MAIIGRPKATLVVTDEEAHVPIASDAPRSRPSPHTMCGRELAHLLSLTVLAVALGCATIVDDPDGGAALDDAGALFDAGSRFDAGSTEDAGVTSDGGARDDAGSVDAGLLDDGGSATCAPLPTGVTEGSTGAPPSGTPIPQRRVVLMGGSVEVDDAAERFASGAGGGEVLVLRASGSVTSYTSYFASELSPTPAPALVTTLRLDDALAGASLAVLCRVARAHAVWLPGGDQWDYLGRWPAPLHTALADATTRGVPFGGTSAGAMSLGAIAFDAALGTFTSTEALATPTAAVITLSTPTFAQPELADFVVDTHFSERDREGRMLVLLAHARALTGAAVVYGIGLDERAALVIENGTFDVHTGAIGRRVLLYAFAGEATVVVGQAFSATGIVRRTLEHGATGTWPPDFVDAIALAVDEGVITVEP
jgi:cyanophycinase